MRWPLALLLPLLLSAHRPCVELCSCVRLTPAQQVKHADAIFVGEVSSIRERPRADRAGGPGTDWYAVVHPTVIWKGEPPAVIELPSGFGADCLMPFKPGHKYLILANGSGDRLGTSWCDGTVSTMDPQALDLLAELGPGREFVARENGSPE